MAAAGCLRVEHSIVGDEPRVAAGLPRGTCRSIAQLAESEGLSRSFVNRLLRLTLLASDIVEAILDGRQSKGMQIEELTRAMPIAWEEQRERYPLDALE